MSKKEWKIGQIFVAFSEYLNFTVQPAYESELVMLLRCRSEHLILT
jgi:hypothetical protein